jgi:hypothetical protein
MLVTCCCTNDPPRILVRRMMPVCFQLSCVSLCAFNLSQFGPSNFYCVGSLTSQHLPSQLSLIHYNHLHQQFPVTAAMLRDSIKGSLCNKQMCNCPFVVIVHIKYTILYVDSSNISITILCLKACKLMINLCPVNTCMKGLEKVSLLTEQRFAS